MRHQKDRLTLIGIFKAWHKRGYRLSFWINDVWVLSGASERKTWEANGLLTLAPLIELFIKEKMTRKAADLTYSTIMSIVPILAIIFAVAKGFGMEDMMWAEIEKLIGAGDIMDQVLMSVSKSVEMTKANSGWIFGVALLTLLYTANNALCKLEDIFNEIWNVEGKKGWFVRLPYNMFFLLILPVAILMVGAVSGQMENVMKQYVSFADWMIRCVIVCCVFIAVYKFLPETKVLWRGAIISGIVAGVSLTVWHFIYLEFQNILFNYNKVYGSFAAIPFFLIWALISWIICLIGAKFNMVWQMRFLIKGWNVYDQEKVEQMSLRDKLQIIITVASTVVREFMKGKEVTMHRLIAETELSDTYVGYALRVLHDSGIVHSIEKEHIGDVYYPSRSVEKMTVGELVTVVYTKGAPEALRTTGTVGECVDGILKLIADNNTTLLREV